MASDEKEKIVQMAVDNWSSGCNLFCLTNKGRIFVRMSGGNKKEWALMDLPTFDDNVIAMPRF